MAGLVAAIHESIAVRPIPPHTSLMDGAWVYIVTNRPNGTLYTGVTTDLARRI
jgi:putative endonuclease